MEIGPGLTDFERAPRLCFTIAPLLHGRSDDVRQERLGQGAYSRVMRDGIGQGAAVPADQEALILFPKLRKPT